ncbi:MAG: polysaccharide deacetylase family protein [Stigonema ocellatum SAG 48.90 = DSM 106950]|nr:polysaccharide deacetylase family protein [Stigonema ocellatum SAG 48.90 = DSM 106950]
MPIGMILILFLVYINAPRIPILGFHGIVDMNNPNMGIIQNPIAQRMAYPMQNLEKVLEYLARNNYWFLSTQNLYDYFISRSHDIPEEYFGKKPIMLSFDDSYKTVYTNVIPVLEKLEKKYNQKIKIVLFVNPGTLAKHTHPSTTYLSCEDLRTGFQKGFYDIQSHGQNHKDLTKLAVQDLTEELAQAQTQLRDCMTGLAEEEAIAKHIAYPYGAMNSLVEAYAAKYYQSGYLYNSTILRFRWLKDKYQISRLTVNRDKSPERLIQMATRSFPISNLR